MYFPGQIPSASYIYAKVLAAEADASRRLRTIFVPTVIVPEGSDPSVGEAYTAADTPWEWEPAYDWNPEFFEGNQWGFMQTRQRPIIDVTGIHFVYPSTHVSMYAFPIAWIRMDKKYGHIRIVPTGNTTTLPLNAWLLQVFNGGSIIPHMIQIFYTAGLENAYQDWPQLIDTIKRMAVLRILRDQFVPQSASVSADGLSQSLSVDISKYEDMVSNELETLREALAGIRMGFL